MTTTATRSLTTRSGPLAYAEFGDGPPILLLHATLHDRHDFDAVVPALARKHRVIALDWPAHGESAPPLPGPVSAPLFGDLVEDVVDQLGLDRVVVIGNSVGGYAAARLALSRPDAVAGLVLVDSGGFTRVDPFVKAFCRLLGTAAVARRVMPAFVRAYMHAGNAADRAIADATIARLRTDAGIATVTAIWRSFADPAHDLRTRAAAITAPTLIVWGTKDRAIPLGDGRRAAATIPGARFHTLPTGHVVFASDPDGFLAIVEPFLAQIPMTSRV